MKKDCIVCHGAGRYNYADNRPGRKRVDNPLGWQGPCPHCVDGKVYSEGPVDWKDMRAFLEMIPRMALDKPAGGL